MQKDKILSESLQDHILPGGHNSSSQIIDNSQGGKSSQGSSTSASDTIINNPSIPKESSRLIQGSNNDSGRNTKVIVNSISKNPQHFSQGKNSNKSSSLEKLVSGEIGLLYNWKDFYKHMGIKYPFEKLIATDNRKSFRKFVDWAQEQSLHYKISEEKISFEKTLKEVGIDSSDLPMEMISYEGYDVTGKNHLKGTISPIKPIGDSFLNEEKIFIRCLERTYHELPFEGSRFHYKIAAESVSAIMLFMSNVACFAGDKAFGSRLYNAIPIKYRKD